MNTYGFLFEPDNLEELKTMQKNGDVDANDALALCARELF